MKPLFKEVAACPACHARLAWNTDSLKCGNADCARTYSLVGDVPVLDLSEDVGSIKDPVAGRSRSRLRQMISSALVIKNNTYRTREGRGRQQRFISSFAPDAIILNVGSGTDDYGPRVINLDIGPFDNVDVVGRSEWLPVLDESVDAVITTGVLEHVGNLPETLREIDRVVRPGGQVFHEVPFIQGFHGPIDHRRFTYLGTRGLVGDYELIDEGVAFGPSSAMVWLLSEWLAMLASFGNHKLYQLLVRIFSKIVRPLRYLDAILETRPEARNTACSFFVNARKPDVTRQQ